MMSKVGFGKFALLSAFLASSPSQDAEAGRYDGAAKIVGDIVSSAGRGLNRSGRICDTDNAPEYCSDAEPVDYPESAVQIGDEIVETVTPASINISGQGEYASGDHAPTVYQNQDAVETFNDLNDIPAGRITAEFTTCLEVLMTYVRSGADKNKYPDLPSTEAGAIEGCSGYLKVENAPSP